MKKLNKFFAILVSLAMMATLCVCMAFAEGTTPAPNTTDFAVTKLLKVPTGTAIPANSSVNVKIDFVSLNSVPATDAQNTAYDREITLNLSGDPAATETDGATTYYYFTTGNMLEELGLDQAGAGVYKFEISENTYKINNTAYDALEAPENATIEEGGTFELTVAKTVNNTYSITASLDENKVEVKDVKTDEEHDASIEDNGVKLINTYYKDGSGDNFDDATFKVTKSVTGDNGLYTPGDAFTMDLTVVLPDIEGVTAEGFIRHYNYNADTGLPADTPVTFTPADKNLALANGDIFYLTKAPTGTLVTVAEDDARAGTAAEGKMYTKSGDFEDEAVSQTPVTKTITNAYNQNTTEGVLHNSLPFIVLALVAVGGLVAYVIVRRRNEDEA